MTYLTILAQTRSSAFAEIIIMLIIAAAIGFITAWLYYQSVCRKKVAEKQKEIDRLIALVKDREASVTALAADLDKSKSNLIALEAKNKKQSEEIVALKKEIDGLKALHAEAVKEIDQLKLEGKHIEQELQEKDAVLTRIAQKKHLLNYESFGKATAAEKNDLKIISGIGPFIEEKLNALDIFTFKQIAKFTKKDVSTVTDAIEFFPGRIDRDKWIPQAIELLKSGGKNTEMLEKLKSRKHKIDYDSFGKASREEADDLTRIKGIGPWIQEKLNALDIFTFRQIGNFTKKDIENVTEVIEFFPGRIVRDKWVDQASKLTK